MIRAYKLPLSGSFDCHLSRISGLPFNQVHFPVVKVLNKPMCYSSYPAAV